MIVESKSSADLFKNAVAAIGYGIIITDNKGIVISINNTAEEMTGWQASSAIDEPVDTIFDLIDEKSRNRFSFSIQNTLLQGKAINLPSYLILVDKDKTKEYYISGNSAPVKDSNNKTMGVVITFADITEQIQKEQEIRYYSFHDSLTGLYNRGFFEEELKRMDTERQLPLSLILGDANGLKLVNDAFGHYQGDILLIKIANILREICRKEDIITRVGGDEFVIILPNVDIDEAKSIIERIKSRCNEYESDPIKPSIALGASTKISMDQNIQMVYRQSEEQMYTTKLNESKRIRKDIIFSIRRSLERCTHETREHGDRIKILAASLGRRIGLNEHELYHLEMLSVLHDIGKIAVPECILEKPEELLNEEWKKIKKHCEIGYRIATYSPELAPVADGILSHHERWDGKGYPQGLAGERIPVAARIISIIDTFDVLTNDRPYKAAISKKEALGELLSCAGTQFDPTLIKEFIEMLSTPQSKGA